MIGRAFLFMVYVSLARPRIFNGHLPDLPEELWFSYGTLYNSGLVASYVFSLAFEIVQIQEESDQKRSPRCLVHQGRRKALLKELFSDF